MCMFNVSLCAYGASVSCVCLSVYLGVIKVFFYTNIIKKVFNENNFFNILF